MGISPRPRHSFAACRWHGPTVVVRPEGGLLNDGPWRVEPPCPRVGRLAATQPRHPEPFSDVYTMAHLGTCFPALFDFSMRRQNTRSGRSGRRCPCPSHHVHMNLVITFGTHATSVWCRAKSWKTAGSPRAACPAPSPYSLCICRSLSHAYIGRAYKSCLLRCAPGACVVYIQPSDSV